MQRRLKSTGTSILRWEESKFCPFQTISTFGLVPSHSYWDLVIILIYPTLSYQHLTPFGCQTLCASIPSSLNNQLVISVTSHSLKILTWQNSPSATKTTTATHRLLTLYYSLFRTSQSYTLEVAPMLSSVSLMRSLPLQIKLPCLGSKTLSPPITTQTKPPNWTLSEPKRFHLLAVDCGALGAVVSCAAY